MGLPTVGQGEGGGGGDLHISSDRDDPRIFGG